MNRTSTLLAAAAIAALLSTPAAAATVVGGTQSYSFASGSAPFSFSLAGFDSTLGTLTSVDLTLEGLMDAVSGTLVRGNQGNNGQTYDVTSTGTLALSGGATSNLQLVTPLKNIAAPRNSQTNFTLNSTSNTLLANLTTNLAGFVAPSVQFALSGSNAFSSQPNNGISFTNGAANFSGLVKVVYNYDAAVTNPIGGGGGGVGAVPEPATWAMMILGFFGLGSVLRRGNRQQLLQTATA